MTALRPVGNLFLAVGILLDLWGTAVYVSPPWIPPPCAVPADGAPPPGSCGAAFVVTMESLVSWTVGTALIVAGVALRVWDSRHSVPG